ncbi:MULTISPECIES: DUF7344 domain-containing protein [Halorussus]|uniref:DUF7344 domain-containing protein n=1 Tax=Halorussus TaxID=1070314 RepID=UPI0020A08D30|nr:hypothetical protein [Halorussus vallis]USZ74497.1 hypothetical protein NGM07_13720 [Halorussus vallis]
MTIRTTERRKSISPDVILSAVANDYRRVVLRALHHTDEEAMGVNALVDRVADRVGNGEPPDDEHRQYIHTALHHVHLPKLEDCGMIVHDTETDQVRNVTGELGQELLALVAPYETGE